MIRYLARRFAGGVAVIAGLLVFAFLATHYIGDPVSFLVNPELTPKAEQDRLREEGGFNRPVWEQLADYLGDSLRGDFGTSVWQNRPASAVVIGRIPATARLAGITLLVTFLVSIPMAALAARREGGPLHVIVVSVTSVLAALPPFWVALALIFLLAVQWRLVPTSGYGWGKEMVVPVVALSLAPIGRYTQVLETAIRKELGRQYVSTARAKGLSERTVLSRHVMRNAAILGITLVGAEVVTLLNGAVLIEQVCAWPGVGQVLLEAVVKRDLPVVMAGVIYVGVIVVVINLLVDVLYAYVDPRVRLG